jgi:hypothetical protein
MPLSEFSIMTDVARPEGVQAQIAGLAEQAQTTATGLVKTAQDRARDLADEQKSAAAEQIEEVARTIDDAGAAVERALPQAAPYVRQAASTVRAASSALRDRSVDDLITMASDFARRQPAAMAGLSLFAGFAMARFLKASADRRETAVRAGSGPRSQGAKGRRPANISSPAPSQPNTQTAGGSSSSGSEGASASPTSGAERNRSDGQ